jgi:hypothetical protein
MDHSRAVIVNLTEVNLMMSIKNHIDMIHNLSCKEEILNDDHNDRTLAQMYRYNIIFCNK